MQRTMRKRLNLSSPSQLQQDLPQKKLKHKVKIDPAADYVRSSRSKTEENENSENQHMNGYNQHESSNQQLDGTLISDNATDVSGIPLPAQIIECVLNETDVPNAVDRSPSSSPTPEDNEIEAISNLGSEVESDEDDSEDHYSMFFSRVQRIFLGLDDAIKQDLPSQDEQSQQDEKRTTLTEKFESQTPESVTQTKECLPQFEESLPQSEISSPKAEKLTNNVAETLRQNKNDLYQSNLNEFKWKPFPDPFIPIQQRRENFKATIGPIKDFATPYEAFVAIWDRQIMGHIADETNRYATQTLARLKSENKLTEGSRLNRWTETNIDELYVFFALVLATGICIKQDIKEYFRVDGKIYDTPNFKEAMTYNRFLLINKFLHFNDNKNIKGRSLSEAKLFKIQPIVTHLNEKFANLYELDRNIVIDNSLSNFRGWLIEKGFSRHNAASGRLNTIELCEAKSGYLSKFEIYDGKQIKSTSNNEACLSSIATRVLKLLHGLENKGHTVWMEQYYTSPALARTLKSKGFDCVGTLRTDCQFVPNELAQMKKEDIRNGEIKGCTCGDVDLILCQDNRVAILSTYHGNAAQEQNGKDKPLAIQDFKNCVSGLDKRDHMLAVYPIERKNTKTWYKILFRRLLNISVLNSLILHKTANVSARSTIIITHHRSYREELVQQIMQKHTLKPTIHPVKVSLTGMPIFPVEYWEHFPAEYGLRPGPKRERIRKSCVLCHKRMQTYCPGCNVPLCAFTCHKLYHTES